MALCKPTSHHACSQKPVRYGSIRLNPFSSPKNSLH
uniref:Uncharacterized protein n=1 Tax=Anguilla anguilla TaxID=7936 RepID=A0A0E9SR02_ANGAN